MWLYTNPSHTLINSPIINFTQLLQTKPNFYYQLSYFSIYILSLILFYFTYLFYANSHQLSFLYMTLLLLQKLVYFNILQIYLEHFTMKHQQHQAGGQQFTISLQALTNTSKQLIQCLQQNTNLRMKYPEDPEKFYPPQEQMHTLLQQLSELSQEHIPLIINSHMSQPFVRLLTHPNIDLSVEVIEILYDLLQEEPQNDQLFEIYYRWIVWLVENSCVEALVGILTRIDEQNNMEEYEAGLKCLKLVEILMNVTDDVYVILGDDRQLFEYLANRIMPNFVVKHKIIDDNKYASSDILVGLLSNSQKSQQLFSQFSGIEVLLQTISSYENKLPTNQDEKQFLNNLFSCLSILLMNFILPQNKKTYDQMKGNYLMISFIKMKNQYSAMALKCMANSLVGLDKNEEEQAVRGIINDGGLKYLFAVFRRKGLRGEDVDEQKALDQNCLNIFYCMTRSVSEVFKDRLEYKLMENRFENMQRFFQLRNQYMQASQSGQIAQQSKQKSQSKNNNTQYLNKLSQGLSLVETIDKTILVLAERYSKLRGKLATLFKIYGLKYQSVERIIKDHYQYIGPKQQKAFVEYLLGNSLLLVKKMFTNLQQEQKEQNKLKQQNAHS